VGSIASNRPAILVGSVSLVIFSANSNRIVASCSVIFDDFPVPDTVLGNFFGGEYFFIFGASTGGDKFVAIIFEGHFGEGVMVEGVLEDVDWFEVEEVLIEEVFDLKLVFSDNIVDGGFEALEDFGQIFL